MAKNNTPRHKHLLLVAFKHCGEFSDKERQELRKKVSGKLIDKCSYTHVAHQTFGECVLIFDSYVIDQLGITQRIRHSLRVFKTAVFRYVGINSVVHIIKFD